MGGRTAFRDIRRQLTDQELAQTGTQKIILEDFEKAEAECATLKDALNEYRDRCYRAELKVGVLTEAAKTIRSIEIMFACGLALGGWVAGLAPYLWDRLEDDSRPGWIALLIGLGLMIGAAVGRLAKK